MCITYLCNKLHFMQKTILVVEDDLGIQELIQLILSTEGYDVICSADDTFYDNLRNINPSLILMDNKLSGISGGDLCLKIKGNHMTLKFPVILLSANTGIEKLADEKKADGFLAKPFDIGELTAIVAKHSL